MPSSSTGCRGGSVGTFKPLPALDGRHHGIEVGVELGADVPLEGLDGQVWRFYE